MHAIRHRRFDMPVTKDQARLLVPLIIASRPYGAPRWDHEGVMAALAKVADRSLPEVVIAGIRAATDATAKTPGVIATSGKAWESDTVPADAKTRPHPPKRRDECPHHPGQRSTSCGGCAADARADDGPDTPPRTRTPGDTTTGAAACRAALHHPERTP